MDKYPYPRGNIPAKNKDFPFFSEYKQYLYHSPPEIFFGESIQQVKSTSRLKLTDSCSFANPWKLSLQTKQSGPNNRLLRSVARRAKHDEPRRLAVQAFEDPTGNETPEGKKTTYFFSVPPLVPCVGL